MDKYLQGLDFHDFYFWVIEFFFPFFLCLRCERVSVLPLIEKKLLLSSFSAVQRVPSFLPSSRLTASEFRFNIIIIKLCNALKNLG